MTKAKILSDVLKYISITHHSKGRLRLDVSSKIRELKDIDPSCLDDVFKINGIDEVKVNKILGKVTILYNADIINPSFLDDLINAKDETQIVAALERLNINA